MVTPITRKQERLNLLTNALYLNVNAFSTKVLIETTSEPREGLAICRVKAIPSFFSHFKTPSNGPAPGIESATFRSVVKPSTDWANPAAGYFNAYLRFINTKL